MEVTSEKIRAAFDKRCLEMEVERRFSYVAITRAKKACMLTVRPERTIDAKGNEHVNPESRFVKEAMDEYKNRVWTS